MFHIWHKSRPIIRLTKDFRIDEFMCRCGCGYSIIDTYTVLICQCVRNLVNTPIVITSGYRCPKHNKNIGGALQSRHLMGLAADLTWMGAETDLLDESFKDKIRKIAFDNPEFLGIGWGKAFLHVDTDFSRKTITEWEY